LEDFIKRHGDSFFGTLAHARLDELKKSQVAVVAPPVAPTARAASSGPRGSAHIYAVATILFGALNGHDPHLFESQRAKQTGSALSIGGTTNIEHG
jgi:hypothetical protein